MSKKPKLLRALDVVPGKVYMARMYHNSKSITWEPCIVECTSEPGWQRGHVEIVQFAPWPMARIKFLEPNVLGSFMYKNVHVKLFDDEYVFCDSISSPTLIEMPTNWALNTMKRVQADLDALNKRMEFLTQIHVLTTGEE